MLFRSRNEREKGGRKREKERERRRHRKRKREKEKGGRERASQICSVLLSSVSDSMLIAIFLLCISLPVTLQPLTALTAICAKQKCLCQHETSSTIQYPNQLLFPHLSLSLSLSLTLSLSLSHTHARTHTHTHTQTHTSLLWSVQILPLIFRRSVMQVLSK